SGDMRPFSLAELGLSEEEIAGLDSLQADIEERPSPGAGERSSVVAPAQKTPPPPHTEPAAADLPANEEQFDADLPLDLQPFSLDELDLGTTSEADRGVGNLPPSLQPFSLDEDAHLGLFSLDDVPLRGDEERAAAASLAQPATPEQAAQPTPEPPTQQAPEPPAAPTPIEEFDNVQDAIAAGQMQPFSLA